MTRVHLSSPDITPHEEQRVLDAIRSGWVAPLGPDVNAFERAMAARVGAGHAVALSSGTAALHLVLVSWGVGPGDHVPTSTLTFAATANAISYTGATPVFIDSDPATGNIDPALLDDAIARLRADGKDVPAIVPVDLLGRCADYAAIAAVAARHGVKVLSDSAESLGARSGDVLAGSFGDAAILSFNGNKIMTTSGGGMVMTDDAALADHVHFLSTQAREPAAHYEHKQIGYNYRLSNLLAGLGRAQLERLDRMIARRRQHRAMYAELFAPVDGVEIFQRAGDEQDNCWLTAILVDADTTGWSSGDLLTHLATHDIESRPLWKPMHLQPVFAGHPQVTSGAAEHLFHTGLSLPSGSALTTEELGRVTGAISGFLGMS
ncbi:DegT/DnrJ/EryC1/StrS family aminotransferase [Aeromicrobium wangtongii]|uniref:DegT/DnrJ/EryC1/StrS family aminotransferase n=1 Tax=Aeromicrobium wangtongii TaxID=2969247 RepID=UPI002016B752|nr:aminotransferase class I/II-fold pyridoxal phosphate-dependent enzyme [Aeromicrobium wangtongii]MCL3817587.1 aminotransferase class I/II-fold pyridoxal phosphate-dependent enzyme [Aeromicrobium wangtongii]